MIRKLRNQSYAPKWEQEEEEMIVNLEYMLRFAKGNVGLRDIYCKNMWQRIMYDWMWDNASVGIYLQYSLHFKVRGSKFNSPAVPVQVVSKKTSCRSVSMNSDLWVHYSTSVGFLEIVMKMKTQNCGDFMRHILKTNQAWCERGQEEI
jgi:hypothetical protein